MVSQFEDKDVSELRDSYIDLELRKRLTQFEISSHGEDFQLSNSAEFEIIKEIAAKVISMYTQCTLIQRSFYLSNQNPSCFSTLDFDELEDMLFDGIEELLIVLSPYFERETLSMFNINEDKVNEDAIKFNLQSIVTSISNCRLYGEKECKYSYHLMFAPLNYVILPTIEGFNGLIHAFEGHRRRMNKRKDKQNKKLASKWVGVIDFIAHRHDEILLRADDIEMSAPSTSTASLNKKSQRTTAQTQTSEKNLDKGSEAFLFITRWVFD